MKYDVGMAGTDLKPDEKFFKEKLCEPKKSEEFVLLVKQVKVGIAQLFKESRNYKLVSKVKSEVVCLVNGFFTGRRTCLV